MAKEDSTRIGLEDVIAAVGQGAIRALEARQQAASGNNGFFIELYTRCGYPPVILQAAAAAHEDLERGPRPPGPPRKD